MSAAEQPTEELYPRQMLYAYIERHRLEWLPAHHRAERAAGMNAEANAEATELFKPIDKLLDDLSALGKTAIGNS